MVVSITRTVSSLIFPSHLTKARPRARNCWGRWGGGSWLLCACGAVRMLRLCVWGWERGLISPSVGRAGAAPGGLTCTWGSPPPRCKGGYVALQWPRWHSRREGYILVGMGDRLCVPARGEVSPTWWVGGEQRATISPLRNAAPRRGLLPSPCQPGLWGSGLTALSPFPASAGCCAEPGPA